ncbi:hypothetical protein SDC9_98938 [bioreactor metagenome]|uniref:Uncharacterized protein n=1 Tax=bioreactor metagenome TaxID=1076179 RepID=A0A645AG41_9ZZZZ
MDFFHKYDILTLSLPIMPGVSFKEEYILSDDPLWRLLLLPILLILLNAFFAATEIAVISLNETKLRYQAEDGDKKAQKLLEMVRHPSAFLSTIQIGITLSGFLASAFASNTFAERLVHFITVTCGLTLIPADTLRSLSVILITVILSFFTLVFGELVPKRIAMQKSEQVARMASGVVGALSVGARPFIWFLSATTNGILRLLRMDPNADEEQVSESEIRMMVDLGEEKGTIERSERDLIENVFEFNNMTAEDVMIHRTDMVMLWSGDSEAEIVRTMEESGLTRFPVYEEDADDIVGILSIRDYLLNARLESPKPLEEIIRPAYFVPESVRTDVLFRDMQSKKVHMAIVVDEYGGTSGLVTMEDLLEEIVGNIYDEFDLPDEQKVIPLEDNLWRIAGSAELEDMAKLLDMELPEDEEYDTLGGLVFAQLSVIPEDGSQLEVEACGLHIQVVEVVDHRVEWALVSKIKPPEADASAD